MSPGKLLSRVWYGITDMLLCLAKFVVWSVLIAAVVPLLFILTAQMYRWTHAGDWRAVPFDEFLQCIGVALPPISSSGTQRTLGILLAMPATFLLFLIAACAFAIGPSLRKLEAHQHRLILRSRQREIVDAIEDLLKRKDHK